MSWIIKSKRLIRLIQAFLLAHPDLDPQSEIWVFSHQKTDPSTIVLLRKDISRHIHNGPEIVEWKNLCLWQGHWNNWYLKKRILTELQFLFWLIFVILMTDGFDFKECVCHHQSKGPIHRVWGRGWRRRALQTVTGETVLDAGAWLTKEAQWEHFYVE